MHTCYVLPLVPLPFFLPLATIYSIFLAIFHQVLISCVYPINRESRLICMDVCIRLKSIHAGRWTLPIKSAGACHVAEFVWIEAIEWTHSQNTTLESSTKILHDWAILSHCLDYSRSSAMVWTYISIPLNWPYLYIHPTELMDEWKRSPTMSRALYHVYRSAF
jgi:hypothetical protein